MPKKPTKTGTARFAEVVKACGSPTPAVLWAAPEKDPAFMSAVKQNRVMTVRQGTSGADFGLIGFRPGPRSSYLVFLAPLDAFSEKRVIGVKYDLLEPGRPVGAPLRKLPPRKPLPPGRRTEAESAPDRYPQRHFRSELPVERAEPQPVKKSEKEFQVTVQYVATKLVRRTIKAGSRNEARQKAEQTRERSDFSGATITRKAVRVEPVRR